MTATVAIAERTLPHDLDAERNVLGAILVSNEHWAIVAASITGASFYRDAHRRIFEAMARLVDANIAIDFRLLIDELGKSGDVDDVGGPSYIAALADGIPRATNAKYYAGIVREKALLRDAIYAANRILVNAYAAATDASMIVDDGVTALLALATPVSDGAITIGKAAQEYVSSLDAEEDDGTCLPTGLTDLDELLRGGFRKRRLVMIAGRPGLGKTTLATEIAERVAHANVPAAIFSLEMDRRALAEMSVARTAQIDSHRLSAKLLSQKDYDRLGYALEQLSQRAFYIVEDVTTMTQIQAWARRLADEQGVRLFVIDYIQLMGDPNARDRRAEIDGFSRGFKRMAKDLDSVVVVLSQLTRAPERRTDNRPRLSDMKESGSLEADADHVVLIYRDDAYNHDPNNENAGIAELILAKNKGGPTGVARVAYLREQSRFANLAQ